MITISANWGENFLQENLSFDDKFFVKFEKVEFKIKLFLVKISDKGILVNLENKWELFLKLLITKICCKKTTPKYIKIFS